MRPRQKILALADRIYEGSNLTIRCPFCMEDHENQGRPLDWTPTKSMSLTRTGYAILYNCFRASCVRGRGVIHILDGLQRSAIAIKEKQEKRFVPKPYKYRTIPATVENLRSNTTLTQQELTEQHVRYAPDRNTVVFPIFDVFGHEVGVVDRSYTGRSPKSISYWFNNVPKIHHPIGKYQSTACVVVEDVPSSIKAHHYMNSVALLGTNLTSDCLMELRDMYDTLYIALDEDATSEAINMAKKYSIYFKEVRAVPLKKDIKNMNEKELQELFKRL